MALLNSTGGYEDVTVTASATDHVFLARLTAPVNTKLKYKFRAWSKGVTAGNTPIRFTVVRGANLSGQAVSAVTLNKVNSQDGETIQAALARFTTQPSNVAESNGTRQDSFVVTPLGGKGESIPLQLNGGEVACLRAITATNNGSVDWSVEVTE